MKNTVLLAATLAVGLAGNAYASHFEFVHRFTGPPDGQWPMSGVIVDSSGTVYGTTAFGGNGCIIGCGAVYKIAPDGTETILYSFKDDGTDGTSPYSALTRDDDGNLYGATSFGGGTVGCNSQGCGTVFKLEPNGTETVLHSFLDNNNDGTLPRTALVRDAAGNLYGGAYEGGAHARGVIFKIAPDGTETVLHAFAGEDEGDTGNPVSLMADKRGNLYGTTAPMTTACSTLCGAVFKIAVNGTYSLLHVFTGGADGGAPHGKMVFDRSHNLLGTAMVGGTSGFGTIFKIAPDGTFSTVYSFAGGSSGNGPVGDLAVDAAGNVYGTTEYGGRPYFRGLGGGTAFKVAPDGTETVLHALKKDEGIYPLSGMTNDGHGRFYGVTQNGLDGPGYYGSVFKVRP